MDINDKPDELIDPGSPEDRLEGLPDLEKKYRTQMRQIVTQKLDLPVSALSAMFREQIKLNPEFQRRDRWDESRQSRFIESLVMNVPVPPVFLGEDEYGHYVVLDGRQRLTAVSKFLSNQLKLKNLEVWDELNGKTFQDMIKRQEDKYFTRRFIPAVVILKESESVVKYDVFDRLNTGGVTANDMEIRNAIYRGPFTECLHELSRIEEFCLLWNIPRDSIAAEGNKLYQQMDDLSLVLRSFALSEYQEMGGRFRDYLSDFMRARNQAYFNNKTLQKTDSERFVRAARNSWRIFGDKAFLRPPTKDGKRQRSYPLADAIMVALADIDPNSVTDEKAAKARALFDQLLTKEEFLKAISTGTNGKGAIDTRITLAKQAAREALIA